MHLVAQMLIDESLICILVARFFRTLVLSGQSSDRLVTVSAI